MQETVSGSKIYLHVSELQDTGIMERERIDMTFDDFWHDPRIPKRMKRCGPAPVRKALARRHRDEWETILQSLSGYVRHKPDYADYCHLSTYINAERDKVEWDEMDEEAPMTDRQKFAALIANDVWRDSWGERPTREEAKARLDALGNGHYERLKLVR